MIGKIPNENLYLLLKHFHRGTKCTSHGNPIIFPPKYCFFKTDLPWKRFRLRYSRAGWKVSSFIWYWRSHSPSQRRHRIFYGYKFFAPLWKLMRSTIEQIEIVDIFFAADNLKSYERNKSKVLGKNLSGKVDLPCNFVWTSRNVIYIIK